MSEINHERPVPKYPNRETAAIANSIIKELGAGVKDNLQVELDETRGILVKGVTQAEFETLTENPGFLEQLKSKAKGAQYTGSLELNFEKFEKTE